MIVKGTFTGLIVRRHRIVDRFKVNNAVVDVGLDQLLDVMFLAGSQVVTWYVGLLGSPALLAASDTMDSHGGWSEETSYDEADRPEWIPEANGTGIIETTTYADFTMNDDVTIAGLFITDSITKGGVTGNLWSTAKFYGGSKSVLSGDLVRVSYLLQASRG